MGLLSRIFGIPQQVEVRGYQPVRPIEVSVYCPERRKSVDCSIQPTDSMQCPYCGYPLAIPDKAATIGGHLIKVSTGRQRSICKPPKKL